MADRQFGACNRIAGFIDNRATDGADFGEALRECAGGNLSVSQIENPCRLRRMAWIHFEKGDKLGRHRDCKFSIERGVRRALQMRLQKLELQPCDSE